MSSVSDVAATAGDIAIRGVKLTTAGIATVIGVVAIGGAIESLGSGTEKVATPLLIESNIPYSGGYVYARNSSGNLLYMMTPKRTPSAGEAVAGTLIAITCAIVARRCFLSAIQSKDE